MVLAQRICTHPQQDITMALCAQGNMMIGRLMTDGRLSGRVK